MDALTLAPVSVETCDGYLVISKCLRIGSVKPPYEYQYDGDHFATLDEAHRFYTDLERGEIRHWFPVAIVPCFKGIPLGAKKVL